VTVEYEGHVNLEALDTFLQDLLWEKVLVNEKGDTIDIYRLKVVFSFFNKKYSIKINCYICDDGVGQLHISHITMCDLCSCFFIG